MSDPAASHPVPTLDYRPAASDRRQRFQTARRVLRNIVLVAAVVGCMYVFLMTGVIGFVVLLYGVVSGDLSMGMFLGAVGGILVAVLSMLLLIRCADAIC